MESIQEFTRNITVSTNAGKSTNNKAKQVKQPKENNKVNEPCQPIKDTQDIQKAKEYLFYKEGRYSITNKRDYAIFVLMINVARRAGDILNLTVGDILNNNGTFKKEIWTKTEKRGKKEVISLSSSAQSALSLYFKQHPEILSDKDNGLFPSRQSGNKSMGYNNLYAIYKDIESKINDDKTDNNKLRLSTHSARKTWAFQTVIRNKDNRYIIKQVSHTLGHDSEETTSHYLGFDTEETIKLFQNNGL